MQPESSTKLDSPERLEEIVQDLEARPQVSAGLRRRLCKVPFTDSQRARVHLAWAKAGRFAARWAASRRDLRIAEQLFVALGDRHRLADIANLRGAIAAETGKVKSALAAYAEALVRYCEVGDPRGQAAAEFNIGLIEIQSGSLMAALERFERSRSLFERLQDERGIALCRLSLGNVNREAGRWPEALALYLAARETFASIGEKSREARCTMNAANCMADMGRLEDAVTLYQSVIPRFVEIEDRRMEAAACLNLASAWERRANSEEARAECRKALKIFVDLQDKLGMGECRLLLARLAADSARRHEAAAAARLFRDLGDEIHETICATLIGKPYDGLAKLAELVALGKTSPEVLEAEIIRYARDERDEEVLAEMLLLAAPRLPLRDRRLKVSRPIRKLQSGAMTGSKEARRKLELALAELTVSDDLSHGAQWTLETLRRSLAPDEAAQLATKDVSVLLTSNPAGHPRKIYRLDIGCPPSSDLESQWAHLPPPRDLSRRKKGRGGAVLTLGSLLGSGLPDLPGVTEEAALIGATFPEAIHLSEREVDRHALFEALRTRQWVHIATHAVPIFDRHPGSGLILADPANGFEVVGGAELRNVKCRADLVVLSACATAPGTRRGVGLSLAESLVCAGARCVIASSWPVEDRAARVWMGAFYQSLRTGLPVEEAQQEASRHCRSAGFADERDWAAWQLYGDFGVRIELPL